jgi:LPXTG-motif cell wall-anchored protein
MDTPAESEGFAAVSPSTEASAPRLILATHPRWGQRLFTAAMLAVLTACFIVPVSSAGATTGAHVQRGADLDSEAAGDLSGYSVALSADGFTVAIGAPDNDGTGSNAGHVRVYRWDGSAWAQLGADIDGEAAGDSSGWSAALSDDGNTVAIGAIFNAGTGVNAGHVRVYRWDGSAWAQRGADIDGEAADDFSGWSVALSADGDTVAIGALRNDGTASDAGHVRVYRWDGNAWAQRGIDIDGEAAGDLSGYSVALSADGDTVAIGARGNDGAADNAGHVRIYRWTGSAWAQRGADIDGEAANDQSGWSVALSTDGDTVAIGAPNNAGTGNNAGHVRVYRYQSDDDSATTSTSTTSPSTTPTSTSTTSTTSTTSPNVTATSTTATTSVTDTLPATGGGTTPNPLIAAIAIIIGGALILVARKHPATPPPRQRP